MRTLFCCLALFVCFCLVPFLSAEAASDTPAASELPKEINGKTIIWLEAPEPDKELRVQVVPNCVIGLRFKPEEPEFSRLQSDLVFEFDNKGKLILSDFFVLDQEEQLPMILTDDGMMINSNHLLDFSAELSTGVQ